jgi:hypothetical protein
MINTSSPLATPHSSCAFSTQASGSASDASANPVPSGIRSATTVTGGLG